MNIEQWQIKAIYALANSLGLVEINNKSDALHEMVYSITNKRSIKDLQKVEANLVISRLKGNMKGFKHHNITAAPGMVNKGQEKKIWALLFELAKYDSQKDVPVGKRLTGFLKKYAGVNDLRFLTYENANKVIEGLKGIIATEKRKNGGTYHAKG